MNFNVLDPDPQLDPHSQNLVDQDADPHMINADPHTYILARNNQSRK